MCAPIPKEKWSWKYDFCRECGTQKNRHKGHGLCVNCYDKKRAENPKRKQQLKSQLEMWYVKVKGTEEHKKYQRERVKEWQKNNPRAHRRNWEKGNFKKSSIKFLKSTAKNKTQKGMTIIINGRPVKTNIKPPEKRTIGTEKDDTIRKIEMFKKIYQEVLV